MKGTRSILIFYCALYRTRVLLFFNPRWRVLPPTILLELTGNRFNNIGDVLHIHADSPHRSRCDTSVSLSICVVENGMGGHAQSGAASHYPSGKINAAPDMGQDGTGSWSHPGSSAGSSRKSDRS